VLAKSFSGALPSRAATMGARKSPGSYYTTRWPNRDCGPRQVRALIDFLKAEAKQRGLKPTSPLGSGISPNYRLVGPARR
jgi:hypothetical protein